MSRIGQKPIEIPQGVEVKLENGKVSVKGPQGELSLDLIGGILVTQEGSELVVTRPDETKQSKSYHGLVRSLIANMVEGVAKGFTRELEIQGVGFRAEVQGQTVSMLLGFSSAKVYEAPAGVSIKVDNGTAITISGPDKQKVGDTAAQLRAFCPAEPYKGKGVRYKGEHVRRKVGKTVA